MPRERDELHQALAGGEWLRVGELAIALGVSVRTAHRLLDSGEIGYRYKAGGKQRIADPADALRLISEAEQVHRGAPSPGDDS